MMSGYSLLAFEARILHLPEKLTCYPVPMVKIPIARTRLNNLEVPHFVTLRETGETVVCTPTDVLKELKELGAGENYVRSLSPLDIPRLVRSSVRIVLHKKGWTSAGAKLFDPATTEAQLVNGLVDVYKALVVSADVVKNRVLVFVDPARKLEFNKSLSEIEQMHGEDLVRQIRWVKVLGTPKSFYVENWGIPSNINQDQVLSKAKNAVYYILKTHGYSHVKSLRQRVERLKTLHTDELVVLTPKSRRLLSELRAEQNLTVRFNGRDYVVLPKSALTPVASLDNVTIFGKVEQLVMTPKEKVDRALSVAGPFSKVELAGFSFELKTELASLDCSKSELSLKVRRIDKPDKPEERISNIDEYRKVMRESKIVCAENWKFYVATIHYKLEELKSSLERYEELESRLYDALKNVLTKNPYKDILSLTGVKISTEKLDKAIKLAETLGKIPLGDSTETSSSGKDNVRTVLFVVVFGVFGNKLEKASLEYSIASIDSTNELVPILIDVGETVEKLAEEVRKGNVKKVYPSRVAEKVEHKIRTAIRHRLSSYGCVPFNFSLPEPLRGYRNIIGVDATVMYASRGQLYLGVPVVIVKENGLPVHRYYEVVIEENEYESLAQAIRKTHEELCTHEKGEYNSIFIVNKENITRFLRTGELENVLKESILVGMTKTHSYSRILRRVGNNYYNVEFGTYTELGVDEVENYKLRKALAVTTQYMGKGIESGTKKSTFIAVAHRKDLEVPFEKLVSLLLSMNLYGNVSPTWILSLPWPLHRAHELCEKIHRLVNNLGILPKHTPEILRRL